MTLHRPELVDDDALLRETVAALEELAAAVPVVFPAHPRTQHRLDALGLVPQGVRLAGPLGYLDFLGLEAEAQFVLTDSGGLQEETSSLGVPCFTLRDNTERPVTVELGTNTLLGMRPERIPKIVELAAAAPAPSAIPLWDAEAGDRAAAVIAAHVERAAAFAVA